MDDESLRRFEEGIQELADRLGITNPILKSFANTAKKSSAEFKKSIEDLNKEVKKGQRGYADQLRKIEELNDAIDGLTGSNEDASKKQQLLLQREELVRAAANQRMKEAAEKFGNELTVNALQSTNKFVRQMQTNSSGAELSQTVMNAAIDATATTLGAVGTAAQTAGTGLLAVPNLVSKVVGGLLLTAGTVFDFAGEAGKATLKFANEILAEELRKTEKAFTATNAAGAVFANGMEGMRNASYDAGLNLQQFSNVISKQSGDLALSGMGVAEGARKVGQVGKIFDANGGFLRKQMQRLGYGFEEQAELTATIMGNMARSGKSFDAPTLAKETQKYAENLRLVSALTGEDAKAKAKQVQEQNQIAAFQQKIAEMGPEAAAQIDLAMANMTEVEKKAFRDRVVFNGAVIGEEQAIYEATNRAAAEKGAELYTKFLNHAFDASAVIDSNAKYREQTLQSFKDNQAIFVAGYATSDATLQSVSAAYLEARTRDLKTTQEAETKVREDIAKAKKPTNELTEGMVAASTAAQSLSINLEKKLLPLLGTYANATGTMLTGLQNLINLAYGTNKSDNKGHTTLDALTHVLKQTAYGGAGGAGVGALVGGIGALPGAVIGGGGGLTKGLVDIYKGEYANGGVAKGPVSGYSATLHGTEAVVPLPDNRSIPVSLDSSSITAAVNQQSSILSEILRAMQNNNSLTSQIVQNSY